MKKTSAFILLFVMLFCTISPLAAEEPKGSGSSLRYYTYEELTGFSKDDIDHIVIRSGVDGVGYSTAYDKITDNIYDILNTKSFRPYVPEGNSGGWKYIIMFFDKDNKGPDYTISRGIIVPEKDGLSYRTLNEPALEYAVQKAYKQISLDCSNWASDYIVRANDLGISKEGIEYKKPITREKFCEMIYNMIDKSMSLNWQMVSPNPFCDTDNEKVISLYLEGITKGKGNLTFAPDDILSREEAATILMRAAGAIGIGFPENAYDTKVYSDEDLISDWAFASVHYARKIGIMEGTSKTEFSPKEAYTAQEAIASVLRLYDKTENKIPENVFELADKDGNVILTENDVEDLKSYSLSDGEQNKSVEICITEAGREKLKEATRKISQYPDGGNFVVIHIDGKEEFRMNLHTELDSDSFVISGSETPKVSYAEQRIKSALKE